MFGTGSFLSHVPTRDVTSSYPKLSHPPTRKEGAQGLGVHKEKVVESKASCLPPLTFAQPCIPKGSPWPPFGSSSQPKSTYLYHGACWGWGGGGEANEQSAKGFEDEKQPSSVAYYPSTSLQIMRSWLLESGRKERW